MNKNDSEPRCHVLRTGALACYDSMCGMLPCKVLAIRPNVLVAHGEPAPNCDGPASNRQMVTVRLTADRPPWKKGEVLEAWGLRVVPRDAYFPRGYGRTIGYYTVECDK